MAEELQAQIGTFEKDFVVNSLSVNSKSLKYRTGLTASFDWKEKKPQFGLNHDFGNGFELKNIDYSNDCFNFSTSLSTLNDKLHVSFNGNSKIDDPLADLKFEYRPEPTLSVGGSVDISSLSTASLTMNKNFGPVKVTGLSQINIESLKSGVSLSAFTNKLTLGYTLPNLPMNIGIQRTSKNISTLFSYTLKPSTTFLIGKFNYGVPPDRESTSTLEELNHTLGISHKLDSETSTKVKLFTQWNSSVFSNHLSLSVQRVINPSLTVSGVIQSELPFISVHRKGSPDLVPKVGFSLQLNL